MSASTAYNPEIVYDKATNTKHVVNDFNNDYTGAKMGFWIFLFTELMLFGAMFLIYGVYFWRSPEEFVAASKYIGLGLGTFNTFVLLVSAFTMGLSLLSIKQGKAETSKKFLLATIILSIVFICVKYFEWSGKFAHGIWPSSDKVLEAGQGMTIFFGLYFTMTGFHAVHVIVGIGVMIWLYREICAKEIHQYDFATLENATLYWDFVHLVWVFVFPLYYMLQFAKVG